MVVTGGEGSGKSGLVDGPKGIFMQAIRCVFQALTDKMTGEHGQTTVEGMSGMSGRRFNYVVKLSFYEMYDEHIRDLLYDT